MSAQHLIYYDRIPIDDYYYKANLFHPIINLSEDAFSASVVLPYCG
jgi:hypothetical protein